MKKITFCLLLFLAIFQSHAQVLIGNGTTLKNVPINPYYGYSYSQSIYTAAEINATGNITTISWYYGGPAGNNIPNSQNLKVYLGHTTKTNFSSNSDWEAVSGLTEVYTGGIVVNGPGWASITLTTPFSYNGTDNLVIATADLQTGYDNNGDAFVSHEAGTNRSIVYQSDGDAPNLTTPQDGNRDSFVPNIIFGGISKACPTPFFLNTVMSDSSSAMVVWGNAAQGEGNSSQYYYSTTNVAPLPETIPSGNSASFAMITGLQSGTVYYVWVRNVCGGTPAEWSYPVQFKTECVAATSLVENFDTTAAGSLPSCWEAIIRGNGTSSSSIGTNVGEAFTGANSIKLNNDNAPNTSDVILVLPKVSNLASGTHRLKFYADGNAANNLIIGTLNNTSSTATFTPFQNVSTTANYAEYTVNFSTYTGSNTYIGIKMNSATTYNPVYLDKIRWDMTPVCPDVTGINFSGINPQTATVNWTAGGTETEWEVVYSLASNNATPEALVPVSAATNASKELTGLTSNSLYQVWVRSTCGTNFGEWAGPHTFRTACEAVATFIENFDTTTAPALPSCWSTIIRGTSPASYVNIQNYGFGAYSAPNAVLMTPGSYLTLDTENDVILVSPNLNSLSTATHRLKFYAKGNGNIQIGTLNSNNNTAQFTDFANITVTNDMQEFVVDFSTYTGSDTYIGFRINNATAYSNTYLDNIRWELNPICPDVSEIALQGVTASSATLSWTGSSESAWEVVYGAPTITDPTTLTSIVSSDASTKEITGLTDNTSYVAWVRSDCGTNKGAWIGPISFKTACLPTNLVNENFDAVATNTLPSCWTSIVRGTPTAPSGAFAKVTTSYAHSTTKSVELHNPNQTADNDVILVSPNLSNLGAGTHRLRFYSSYHYASSIQVGTLNNNTSNAVFTVIQDLPINSTWTEFIVDFTQWQGITDQYIGIRLSKIGVNSYAHIDDLVWEVAPTCPDVVTIDVEEITTTDAYVSWEMGELEANSWQVSHALSSVTDASTGTISTVLTTEEFVLDELTPDTEYNVWVRSVCGTLNGDWVGPIKFRTKCNLGSTIDENFDAIDNALPTCWSKIIRGDSFAEFFASVNNSTIGAHSAPNNITMFNSTFNELNDIILVSPPMDNLAAGTHQLSFYLKGNTGDIEVGTLDNNTNEAVFTSLTSVIATPTFTKYTIDFSNYAGADTYIGIRHGGTSNTTINIDDIVWEEIPLNTCVAVADVNENFDTTAVGSLPECWASILRGPTDNDMDSIMVKTDIPGLPSEPNALNIFKGLSTSTDEQIVVLPLLSNLNAGTHKLALSVAGPPCQIEVGTLSNNTDTAVFTLKETIDVTTTWTQAIIDFTNYTGTDTYIGLRLNSGINDFVSMYIDNVIWSATLGNGSFNDSKFVYYPNPVKDILNLSYEQNITNVAVYNVLGQEIMTKKINASKTQIDLSGLASGTYLVKVTADTTHKTFKVIKE